MTKAMTAAPRKDMNISKTAQARRAASAAQIGTHVFISADVPVWIGEHLTRAGLTVMPFGPADLRAALAENTHCAILWAKPAAQLAEALEQGTDPVETIGNWLDEAQSILTAFRRNRRRLTLIEAQALTTELAEPERALLRERLACPTLPLPLAGTEESAIQDTDPSLAAMVAAAIVPRVAEIQDSLSELQGSGLSPLQSELSAAALARLAGSFSGWQAQAAAQAEELDLLRAELALQQQKSEATRTELARLREDLEKKDTALSTAIAKAQTRDKTVIQAAVVLTAERDTAVAERKAVEAALTEATAEMAAEREASTCELSLLRDQIASQQKEFDSTLAEMAAEREASARELSLLRDQIALQQKEFDSTLAEKDAALAKTIAKGEDRDKAVIRAAAEMAAEREASARELSLLRDQIALQQKEFDSTLADLRTETLARRRVESQRDLLLRSTSWRVTRPIRTIRAMISGGNKPVDVQLAEERAQLPKP